MMYNIIDTNCSSLIGILSAAVYEIRQFLRIKGARCSFFAQVIVNGLTLDHRVIFVVIYDV